MKKEKAIDEQQPKKKRKIFKKVLLVLLAFIGIIGIYLIVKNIYYKINDNKIINAMDHLEQEKVSLIFIEINPSFVLTMKDNKVEDIACLNEDCLSFYDDIDVTGKNTNDSIDYLYKLSKDKGFDTSKGVNVKTTTEIEVNLDYVKLDYIDENVKNEILSKALNNDNIKENSQNENYYSKLWEELKKDADYGNVYDCKMINEELRCYLKYYESMNIDESKISGAKRMQRFTNLLTHLPKMARVLNKFGMTTTSGIDMGFSFGLDDVYINDKRFAFNIYDWKFRDYDNEGFPLGKYFDIRDLNLLNPISVLSNLKKDNEEDYSKNSELPDGYYKICDYDGNCQIVSEEEQIFNE